jgi:hypothetical protein
VNRKIKPLVVLLIIGMLASMVPTAFAETAAIEPESLFDGKTGMRFSDGVSYELGTKFRADVPGTITAVKVYGVAGETGDHTVRIWSEADRQVIAGPYTFQFAGEDSWVTFTLPEPVNIDAETGYIVSVSTGSEPDKYYPAVAGDLQREGTNGKHLWWPANAGVYSVVLGQMPTNSYNGANYLRDIVFVPSSQITPAMEQLNNARTAEEVLAILPRLRLDLTAFEQLSEEYRNDVAQALLDARPSGGYTDKETIQHTLNTAVESVFERILAAAIQAVNDAESADAMKQALASADLGLTLTAYNRLTAEQQNAVAERLIRFRPVSGYADRAAIQQALDAQIFPDIRGHWAENMLQNWLLRGFLQGFPDATIRPDEQISGGEFIALANRAFGFTGGEALNAADYLSKPHQKISREEAAVIVAKVLNLDTSISMDAIDRFKDANSMKAENRKYVNAAVAGGYLKGDDNNTLHPHKHMTRADAVALLFTAVDPSPGQPNFFPIGVWLQSPHNALGYKNIGINTYIGLWDPLNDQGLSYLKQANMKVIASLDRTNPKYWSEDTIFAWMQDDEPDNAQPDGSGGWGPPVDPQKLIDNYNRWKAADPSRPIFLNLGQGVAWKDWYGRGVDTGNWEKYREYVKSADIVSFDIYPINSQDAPVHNNLYYVAAGVDNLKEWTNGTKPIWTVIETSNYNGVPGHTPTPDQIRSEVWMALIHGVNGFLYFCHTFSPNFIEATPLQDPVVGPALAELNKQIRLLAPVLNSPTVTNAVSVTSSSRDVPIDTMVKQHNGETYIFSVAMRDGSTTGTFTVPSGSSVQVIGENRTIPIVDGQFSDSFGSYGVHLYKVVN